MAALVSVLRCDPSIQKQSVTVMVVVCMQGLDLVFYGDRYVLCLVQSGSGRADCRYLSANRLCQNASSAIACITPQRKGGKSEQEKELSHRLNCMGKPFICLLCHSITESWRGMQFGLPIARAKDIPQVFAKHYGSSKAAAYGIAGMFLSSKQAFSSHCKKPIGSWPCNMLCLFVSRVHDAFPLQEWCASCICTFAWCRQAEAAQPRTEPGIENEVECLHAHVSRRHHGEPAVAAAEWRGPGGPEPACCCRAHRRQ